MNYFKNTTGTQKKELIISQEENYSNYIMKQKKLNKKNNRLYNKLNKIFKNVNNYKNKYLIKVLINNRIWSSANKVLEKNLKNLWIKLLFKNKK